MTDEKDPTENLRQQLAAIPDLLDLRTVVVEFCRLPPPDEHFHAVQLLCSATMEHYRAILVLVEEANGWAAKVLSRAVLETLTAAVILARHPEKLEDFRQHAKYLDLRVFHFSSERAQDQSSKDRWGPEVSRSINDLAIVYDRDFELLHERFRDAAWHGLKKRKAFEEAGFDFVYDNFFRPLSAIAHGEPSLITYRNGADWKFGRSDRKDLSHAFGAYVSSSLLLSLAMRQMDQIFALQFAERIDMSYQTLMDFFPVYRELIISILSPMPIKASGRE